MQILPKKIPHHTYEKKNIILVLSAPTVLVFRWIPNVRERSTIDNSMERLSNFSTYHKGGELLTNSQTEIFKSLTPWEIARVQKYNTVSIEFQ